jgi:hypothetical protein
MKNKIIIIIVVLAIVGLGIWWYLKEKTKTTPAPASTGTGQLASTNNSTAPQPEITGNIVKSAVIDSPVSTTNAGIFTVVLQDTSDHHGSILTYRPANIPIKLGDRISIDSGPYAGVWNVWYIYEGSRSGIPDARNLYIDAPFKGSTNGTFVKV